MDAAIRLWPPVFGRFVGTGRSEYQQPQTRYQHAIERRKNVCVEGERCALQGSWYRGIVRPDVENRIKAVASCVSLFTGNRWRRWYGIPMSLYEAQRSR